MLTPGVLIDRRYRVLSLLGQGGQSRVYLVLHEATGSRRAIKELRRDVPNPELARRCFLAEADILHGLCHPCLPKIRELIADDRDAPPLIVMDYIDGTSLSALVKERGAQPQRQVVRWALRLCDVLAFLHAQTPPVIYRDLKPGNVILRPDGDLALIDFGSARRYRPPERNPEGGPLSAEDTVPLGTRGYAAPEQFGGHGQSDARTDIYGLGATLYHLLTGQSPAKSTGAAGEVTFPQRPRLSPAMREIVAKCMRTEPGDRYASCEALRGALLHIRADGREAKSRAALVRIAACIALAAPAVGMGILARKHITGVRALPATVSAATSDDAEERRFYLELSQRIGNNREALLAAGVSEGELEEILAYIAAQLEDDQ